MVIHPARAKRNLSATCLLLFCCPRQVKGLCAVACAYVVYDVSSRLVVAVCCTMSAYKNMHVHKYHRIKNFLF